MGTAHPARSRPRPATPVLCARRQEPRRPRRGGRLRAGGVTVVLVAALVPSARADGDGDDGTLGLVDTPAEDVFTEVPAPEQGSSAVVASDGDGDLDVWRQAGAPVVHDGGGAGARGGGRG